MWSTQLERSLHGIARMLPFQGLPATRPQGAPFRVRGVKVPGPAELLGGAPRTQGLPLTSSWRTSAHGLELMLITGAGKSEIHRADAQAGNVDER